MKLGIVLSKLLIVLRVVNAGNGLRLCGLKDLAGKDICKGGPVFCMDMESTDTWSRSLSFRCLGAAIIVIVLDGTTGEG